MPKIWLFWSWKLRDFFSDIIWKLFEISNDTIFFDFEEKLALNGQNPYKLLRKNGHISILKDKLAKWVGPNLYHLFSIDIF